MNHACDGYQNVPPPRATGSRRTPTGKGGPSPWGKGRRFGALSAFLALFAVACLDDDAPEPPSSERDVTMMEDDEDSFPPSPCQQAYGDACNAACSSDNPCSKGLHCRDGECVADCFGDSECAPGICTNDGRCLVESKIKLDPVMTDPSKEEDEPPTCVEGEVEFEAVMPQVWLLLDRSSSMGSSMGDVTQWEALGEVLFGEPDDLGDRGIVGQFEEKVAFGATFFTTGSGPSGCALDLESVALASNSYMAIRQRYGKLSPTGGTPTADSIAAVVSEASSSDLTGGPKILVLATDGAPGACSARSGLPTEEVEHEVELAFVKDIQTFAISIATATDAAHMQRVANLGVGHEPDADPPAPYYTAESQQELRDAFATIIEEVPRSCVFSLNGEVDEENAGEGTVTLAGQALNLKDPDGWKLKRADQVELLGAACARIRAGEEDLDITFPCAVFTPGPIR